MKKILELIAKRAREGKGTALHVSPLYPGSSMYSGKVCNNNDDYALMVGKVYLHAQGNSPEEVVEKLEEIVELTNG